MDISENTSPVDSYIASFPKEVQEWLQTIREMIRQEVPEAVETISYGMPTFKLNGKNLVHFAGWEEHVGFYPTPSGIEVFAKELAQYKCAKGSVQFPLAKPLPLSLIRKIVQFRAKEEKEKRKKY